MPDQEPQRPPGSRPTLLDLMIVVAGVALSLGLLAYDAGPGPGISWRVKPLVRDPVSMWQIGLPLTTWYLLAGPTLSGPIILWLHRRGLRGNWLISGKALWVLMGAIIAEEVVLTYLPPFGVGALKTFDFQWEDNHPMLLVLVKTADCCTELLRFIRFFLIPIGWLVIVAVSLPDRRKVWPRPDWADRLGLALGLLWCLHDVIVIYGAVTNLVTFVELP